MPAVGANLIDHPSVPVLWSTPALKGLWESTGNGGFARWRLTHKGPLTSNIAEAGGFARSDPRLSAPDLQWHVLPVGVPRAGADRPGPARDDRARRRWSTWPAGAGSGSPRATRGTGR